MLSSNLLKILDNVNDSVLIYDREGKLIFTNKAYESLLGINREYASKRVWGKHISDASINYEVILEVLETGIPKLSSLPLLIENAGAEFIYSAIPLKDKEKITGVIVICQIDIVYQLLSTIIAQRKKSKMEQKEIVKFKPKEHLPEPFKEIIGHNISFVRSLVKAAAVANTDSTILILGESGVGKDLLAQAIHRSSSRSNNNFVVLNCAAIPEHLLESELFGYVSGAFTGASNKGKAGKMYLADKGTLFLDEIGDMSLFMQAKILRALQYKQFEKIGGTETIYTDIRFIAATNKDLISMVEKGLFREDLYYRINVMSIYINPLRERMDDLQQLCHYYLDLLRHRYKCDQEILLSPDVIVYLQNYHWPGNIRELFNVLEHSAALVSAEANSHIELQHLPVYFRKYLNDNQSYKEKPSFDYCKPLPKIINEVEEKVFKEVLLTSNNKTEAITKLGISRRTFYKKLKELGLL